MNQSVKSPVSSSVRYSLSILSYMKADGILEKALYPQLVQLAKKEAFLSLHSFHKGEKPFSFFLSPRAY